MYLREISLLFSSFLRKFLLSNPTVCEKLYLFSVSCLFISLVYLVVSFSFLLACGSSLYILDTNLLSVIYCTNFISYDKTYLSTLVLLPLRLYFYKLKSITLSLYDFALPCIRILILLPKPIKYLFYIYFHILNF